MKMITINSVSIALRNLTSVAAVEKIDTTVETIKNLRKEKAYKEADALLAKLTTFIGKMVDAIVAKTTDIEAEDEGTISLGSSEASEILGSDVFINVNIKAGEELTKIDDSAEMHSLIKRLCEGIANRVIKTSNGNFKFFVPTPSQAKFWQIMGIKVGHENDLFNAFGLTLEDLNDKAFNKAAAKVQLAFSAAEKSELPLGWSNIIVVKAVVFPVLRRRLQNLGINGKAVDNVHSEIVDAKVDDAQGVVFQELVEKVMHMDLRMVARQARLPMGKGLLIPVSIAKTFQAYGIDAETWSFNDANGKTWTIESMLAEGKVAIVSEEFVKINFFKDAARWAKFCADNKNNTLFVCGESEEHCSKTIKLSRQHLAPLVGATREELEAIFSDAIAKREKLVAEGSFEAQVLEAIDAEFHNSAIVKALNTASRINSNKEFSFGRTNIPGTFAFCAFEVGPWLVAISNDENGKRREGEALVKAVNACRKLKGSQVAIGGLNMRALVAGRYPTLDRDFVPCQNMGQLTDDLPSTVVFISWDFAIGEILKGDCDGDHLALYGCMSVEEEREVLSSFDFWAEFIPDAWETSVKMGNKELTMAETRDFLVRTGAPRQMIFGVARLAK